MPSAWHGFALQSRHGGTQSPHGPRRKLKRLLEANQYIVQRFGPNGYAIPFGGRLRDWHVRAHINNGWLALTTYVMALPEPANLRAALTERLLELNDVMSVAKFTKAGDTVTLDLEYREEHVDAAVLGNLLSLFQALAEEHYPELFRIAAGDATLATLQQAYQRSSLAAGTE